MTISRSRKRSHLTNSESKKQAKVTDRWRKMVAEYMLLSLEELAAIKIDKRSRTDDHAYKTVIASKEEDSSKEDKDATDSVEPLLNQPQS
jgi:hypothetical protein